MQATEDRTPAKLFDAAMADFRAGSREQATARCRQILSTHPAYADAHHLLGVIEYLEGNAARAETSIRVALSGRESVQAQCDLALTLIAQGRTADAESALHRAIEIDPDFALAHVTLGRLLEERGELRGAEAVLRRALQLNPQSADAHFRLGKVFSVTNRPGEARVMLERSVALSPSADAFNSLAIVLDQVGEAAQAEASFRRALELKPDFAEARCNLGVFFFDANRLDEAESMLRSAAEINPRFAGAHVALGKLFVRQGRVDEAIGAYRLGVELAPADAGAHNALGALLAEAGRLEEAEIPLRRAVELLPQFGGAHCNLGSFLIDIRRYDEGEAALLKALELDPTLWLAHYNLSLMMRDTRRIDRSEYHARRVLELSPMNAAAHVALGNALLGKGSGDIGEALNSYRRALELDPSLHVAHANLAYSNTFATDDGYEILEECKRFAQRFEAPYLVHSASFPNDLSPNRRLRVGYVSPDFRDHCQSIFTMPLLRNHDHDAVEVFCYSSVRHADDVTERLKAFADVWRDVDHLGDDELAQQIRDDRIDILVDLTMHMAKGRPLLFCRRPAPVQIAWLAYPGTTGSNAIGYRFTDPKLDPLDSNGDDRYSEKSIRLPDTFWCYEPLVKTEPEVGPLPALGQGHITFGCLNNPCKLTDRTFEMWAAVMRQVEGSRMTLLLAEGQAREAVGAKFAAMGVDPARFDFLEYQPREQYLRTYQKIDIVLDTFPYNGHTTSLDALWMGVPVVSLTGTTPASRAGYSLLSNLDLQNLTSTADAEFVTNAVSLATDISRLESLRSGLRERMQRSPLMDGAKFAAGMEKAFRNIWIDSCSQSN